MSVLTLLLQRRLLSSQNADYDTECAAILYSTYGAARVVSNPCYVVYNIYAYTCVARRYQYHQRYEPENVYRYAEDYYDRDIDNREDSYMYDYMSNA